MTRATAPSEPSPPVDQLAALRQDLRRYGSRALLREPSAFAVVVYRLGRWNDTRNGSRFGRAIGRMVYLVAFMGVRLSSGIEIPKEASFGPGLRIFHQGSIVVHPRSVVGAGCTLRQGVTIGERRRGAGVPVVGDSVEFGAYAQVLGPIRIGSGVSIGALALVIEDVPADSIVLAGASVVRARRSSTRPAASGPVAS